MHRFVFIAMLVVPLQGCAWLVRDVADFENVDMVQAEPLDDEQPGDLHKFVTAEHDTAQVEQLRGDPDCTDPWDKNNSKSKPACEAGTYLYWKYMARGASAAPPPSCNLSVTPPSDDKGQWTFKWTSENATSFSIGGGINTDTTKVSGSVTVAQPYSSANLGTAVGPGGIATCVASTIAAKPAADAPAAADDAETPGQDTQTAGGNGTASKQSGAGGSLEKSYALNYFNSGIALSDVLCDAWFARLSQSNAAMSEASATIQNMGTTSSLIATTAGASTLALQTITASTGLLTRATGDLSTNYLISPDLGEIARKVRNYRDTYYANIVNSGNVVDYASASSYLQKYHSTCSSDWVKTYLSQAISASQPEKSTTTDTGTATDKTSSTSTTENSSDGTASTTGGSSASDTDVENYAAKTLKPFFKNAPQAADIVYLYALVFQDKSGVSLISATDAKNTVIYSLASHVPSLVSLSNGKPTWVLAPKKTQASVQTAFKSIDSDFGTGLSAAAQKIVSGLNPTKPAAAATPKKYAPVFQPAVEGSAGTSTNKSNSSQSTTPGTSTTPAGSGK